MHGQPVEGGQNGSGVLPQKTSCRVLEQLEPCEGGLID